MIKYGFNYRVEVICWVRTYDGDDWTTREHWYNFNSLDEALAKANKPFNSAKDLIESAIYDMRDKKDLIWKKDWHENKIVDYTTIPDFDYHNREYD
jgi:hypothetical protein